MRWTIKKRGFEHTLLDETSRVAGYVLPRPGGYEIRDACGATVLRAVGQPPASMRISGSRGTGSATMTLGEARFFLPRRAESAALQINGVHTALWQSDKRTFRIVRGQAQIGWIEGMARHPRIELYSQDDFAFAALIYALALWMYHEDDAPMV